MRFQKVLDRGYAFIDKNPVTEKKIAIKETMVLVLGALGLGLPQVKNDQREVVRHQ